MSDKEARGAPRNDSGRAGEALNRWRHSGGGNAQALVPQGIASILQYCRKNHCVGLRHQMIYARYQRKKKEQAASRGKATSLAPRFAPPPSRHLKLKGMMRGVASVEGALIVVSASSASSLRCSGEIIALHPAEHPSSACIVFDVPDRGLVPAMCSTSVLPDEARSLPAIPMQTHRWKSPLPELNESSFSSVPASRGSIDGHIITDGDLRGMAVDGQLLAALQGGSLRRGKSSYKYWYTLDYTFSCGDIQSLRRTAHSIDATGEGLRLAPASRSSGTAEAILDCAVRAKLGMHKFHETKSEALSRLESAAQSNETPPAREKYVQTALGGAVESMQMGSFLPCEGQASGNIPICTRTRCACGFAAPTMEQKLRRVLLRRWCTKSTG